jgi:putative component of membrane protein insertase Oxa1/YidC/SpoIIIJ protein YidD
MLSAAAVSVIEFYQRRFSPLKGFHCAHGALHGGSSCSEAVKRATEAGSLRAGVVSLRLRVGGCRAAMIVLQEQAEEGSEGLEKGDANEEPSSEVKRFNRACWAFAGIVGLGLLIKFIMFLITGAFSED